MDKAKRLYGTGIRFPLVISPGFGWVSRGDNVAQALRSIVLTEPGERIGRPTYGVGLRRFLFGPNDLGTRAAIRQEIIDAIERDEPRVDLDDVEVTVDAAEPTLLRIEIRYRLSDSPGPENLVFHFSLNDGVV